MLIRRAKFLLRAMTTYSDIPPLTTEEFLGWVRVRRERETLEGIARSLAVSAPAVVDWLSGRRVPCRTVRALAALVRSPMLRELEPGLPYSPRLRPRFRTVPSAPTL